MNGLTHLDLFSGIGGFAIAARWAGFQTIGFCEIDPYCQKVLAKNFLADTAKLLCNGSRTNTESGSRQLSESQERSSQSRIYSDIRILNGDDYSGVTLITGGFPCQPFSCAGKRRGKDDDRAIWPEMFRVISEARPAWVLAENVTGIINMELDNVLSDLERIGYSCRPFVIPACGVDARHRRNRVWIVGNSKGSGSGTGLRESGAQQNGAIASNASSNEHVADSDKPGSQGHGRLLECAGQLSTRQSRSPEHCRWQPEPAVCGMVDGLSEKLYGGRIDASQRLDSKKYSQVGYQGQMREMWERVAYRPSSQGPRSLQQLAAELGNALCELSHKITLEQRKEALEAASCYLRNLREACQTIGAVRNPSDSLSEIWRSMPGPHTDWAHMATYKGCFHSEWPDVPRVATGIKNRVQRLRGLGNSILPQVAYQILKAIADIATCLPAKTVSHSELSSLVRLS